MNKPFLLFHCPGVVPQENAIPRFDTLVKAIEFETEENDYDVENDIAFVVELSDDGSAKVVYEFGDGDMEDSEEDED